MFSFREFLMTGFRSAVGKMADYQVILNASGYFEKGVLTEEDLGELQGLLDEKNNPVERAETSEIEEDVFDESE